MKQVTVAEMEAAAPASTPAMQRLNEGIGNFFARLGGATHDKPWRTILLSLLFCAVCSAGFANFKMADDPLKLYTPQDSEAWDAKDFNDMAFGYDDRYGFVIATSDGGAKGTNVLTTDLLLDMLDVYEDITQNLTHTHAGTTWTFHDMCRRAGSVEPWSELCNVRSPLAFWSYNRTTLAEDQDIFATLNASMTDNMGRDLKVESVLGGVTRDAGTGLVTGAAAMRFSWFMLNNASTDAIQRDSPVYTCDWEVLQGDKYGDTVTGGLRTQTSTQCYYRDQLLVGFYEDIILMILDYTLMIAFASFVLARNSPVTSQSTLAVGAVACVILAMASSFGLGSALGLEYSVTVQLLAFLLLGLGIDDAFVITQAYRQVPRERAHRARVTEALRVSGTSISVTSFTDMVVFLSGLGNSLPVIQNLCAFGTLGVLFDWILQLTLFVGMLVLNQRRESKHKADCICCIQAPRPENKCCPRDEKFDPDADSGLQVFMSTTYPKVLLSRPGKAFVLTFTAVWLGVSIWAAPQVEADYDPDWFVPKSSPLYHAVTQTTDYFGGTQERIGLLTGDGVAVDYATNASQASMDTLFANMEEDTHFEQCYGWHPAFKTWYQATYSMPPEAYAPEASYYVWLDEFLSSEAGHQYYSAVANTTALGPGAIVGTKSSCISVTGKYTGQRRIAVMDSSRSVASEFQDSLGATAYAVQFIFVEGLKVMRNEMLTSMAVAAACVLAICVLMIGNVPVAVLVFTVVALVDLNVLAMYYFTDMTFEFLTSIILVLVVGFSVDYSAHIAHAFVHASGTGEERAVKALSEIGRSVLCGGFSTWLAVALLPLSQSYFFAIVLFRSISFAVMFGLFYGLCLIPVVLSIAFPGYSSGHAKRELAGTLAEKSAIGSPDAKAIDMQENAGTRVGTRVTQMSEI